MIRLRFRLPIAIITAIVPVLMAGATAHPAAAFGKPDGCPSGAVCFYHSGDGGDLCGIWYGDAPDLAACSNNGPSGTIFNNGQPCGGCQDVNLYWGNSYSGAWYCLPMGHYLLFIEQNLFDRGGPNQPGFGQTLAYRPGLPNGPGGVMSVQWTSC